MPLPALQYLGGPFDAQFGLLYGHNGQKHAAWPPDPKSSPNKGSPNSRTARGKVHSTSRRSPPTLSELTADNAFDDAYDTLEDDDDAAAADHGLWVGSTRPAGTHNSLQLHQNLKPAAALAAAACPGRQLSPKGVAAVQQVYHAQDPAGNVCVARHAGNDSWEVPVELPMVMHCVAQGTTPAEALHTAVHLPSRAAVVLLRPTMEQALGFKAGGSRLELLHRRQVVRANLQQRPQATPLYTFPPAPRRTSPELNTPSTAGAADVAPGTPPQQQQCCEMVWKGDRLLLSAAAGGCEPLADLGPKQQQERIISVLIQLRQVRDDPELLHHLDPSSEVWPLLAVMPELPERLTEVGSPKQWQGLVQQLMQRLQQTKHGMLHKAGAFTSPRQQQGHYSMGALDSPDEVPGLLQQQQDGVRQGKTQSAATSSKQRAQKRKQQLQQVQQDEELTTLASRQSQRAVGGVLCYTSCLGAADASASYLDGCGQHSSAALMHLPLLGVDEVLCKEVHALRTLPVAELEQLVPMLGIMYDVGEGLIHQADYSQQPKKRRIAA